LGIIADDDKPRKAMALGASDGKGRAFGNGFS
jgi:hypothetical protein